MTSLFFYRLILVEMDFCLAKDYYHHVVWGFTMVRKGLFIFCVFGFSCQHFDREFINSNQELKDLRKNQVEQRKILQNQINQITTQLQLLQGKYQDLKGVLSFPSEKTPSLENRLRGSSGEAFGEFFRERYFPIGKGSMKRIQTLKTRIQTNFQNKRYQSVIRDAKELYAISDDPKVLSLAHLHRAESFFILKKYDVAAADCLEFERLWPEHIYVPRALLVAAQSFETFDSVLAEETYRRLLTRSGVTQDFQKVAQEKLSALIHGKEPRLSTEKLQGMIHNLEAAQAPE